MSRCSTTSRSTARGRARPRTFVLATDALRPVVIARVAGFDDVDVIAAEDVPDVKVPLAQPGTRNSNWR